MMGELVVILVLFLLLDVLSFPFIRGMIFIPNKHKSSEMSRLSKDVALYYDDIGTVQSREQWIQQIQFDLLTGFWKDHLDFIAPDGVRCTASRMFEQQLSTKLLRFYGVVAVEDYNEDEAFFGRRIR